MLSYVTGENNFYIPRYLSFNQSFFSLPQRTNTHTHEHAHAKHDPRTQTSFTRGEKMSPKIIIHFATVFQSSYWRVRYQNNRPHRLACFPFHETDDKPPHGHLPSCQRTIHVEVQGLTCEEADLAKYAVRGEHMLEMKSDSKWKVPSQTPSMGAYAGRTASGAILFSISGKDTNVFNFPQSEFTNAAYRVELLQLHPDGTARCLATCVSSPYYVIYKRTETMLYPADQARPKSHHVAAADAAATATAAAAATARHPQATDERQVTTTRSTRSTPQHDASPNAPPRHSEELQRAKRQRRLMEQESSVQADNRNSPETTTSPSDNRNSPETTTSIADNRNSPEDTSSLAGTRNATLGVHEKLKLEIHDAMANLVRLMEICQSKVRELR